MYVVCSHHTQFYRDINVLNHNTFNTSSSDPYTSEEEYSDDPAAVNEMLVNNKDEFLVPRVHPNTICRLAAIILWWECKYLVSKYLLLSITSELTCMDLILIIGTSIWIS